MAAAEYGETVHIERDPFARGTLVRRTVAWAASCEWCGQTAAARRRKLFEYGWDDDSRAGVAWDGHYFCGRDCRDAYIT